MYRNLPVKRTPAEVLKAVARGQVHHFHRYIHKMCDDLVEALEAFLMFRELLPAGHVVEAMYRTDDKRRPDSLGRKVVRADGVYLAVNDNEDNSDPGASISLQDEGGIYGGVTYDPYTHRWSCWIDGEGVQNKRVYQALRRSNLVFPRKSRKGSRRGNVGKQTALRFARHMVAVFLDY